MVKPRRVVVFLNPSGDTRVFVVRGATEREAMAAATRRLLVEYHALPRPGGWRICEVGRPLPPRARAPLAPR